MARSVLLPMTGSPVWYFSAASGVPPQAAMVVNTVADGVMYDLRVWSKAGVPSVVTNVPWWTGGPFNQAVTAAVVAAGGSGYAVGNTITLANGVVLTVATLSVSAVATVTITNPGAVPAGPAPANPQAQVATNGAGVGATFNLTWGAQAGGAFATYIRSGGEFTPGVTAPTMVAVASGGNGGSGEEPAEEDVDAALEEGRSRTPSRTRPASHSPPRPSHR